jgi:hypothetical protein
MRPRMVLPAMHSKMSATRLSCKLTRRNQCSVLLYPSYILWVASPLTLCIFSFHKSQALMRTITRCALSIIYSFCPWRFPYHLLLIPERIVFIHALRSPPAATKTFRKAHGLLTTEMDRGRITFFYGPSDRVIVGSDLGSRRKYARH